MHVHVQCIIVLNMLNYMYMFAMYTVTLAHIIQMHTITITCIYMYNHVHVCGMYSLPAPATTVDIVRLLLSCLHAWSLDDDLDESCEDVLGLVRPSRPVSFGLLSKGQCLSLVLPGQLFLHPLKWGHLSNRDTSSGHDSIEDCTYNVRTCNTLWNEDTSLIGTHLQSQTPLKTYMYMYNVHNTCGHLSNIFKFPEDRT